MFRLLSKASQIGRPMVSARPRLVSSANRTFQTAHTTYKKKKLQEEFSEEVFQEDNSDDDLFSNLNSSPSSQAQSSSTQPANPLVTNHPVSFEETRDFLSQFCGKTPLSKNHPRQRAILHLVKLADTKVHLDDLVDVIAGWRDARWSIDPQTSDEIIARCINLKHPEVALSLIANRPKFGVDVTSLSVARKLLQSLSERAREAVAVDEEAEPLSSVTSSPFKDVLLLAALYPRYQLGEVYEDTISASILVSLLKSMSNEEARQLERDLLELLAGGRSAGSKVRVDATEKERSWAETGIRELPYTVELS